MTEPPELFAHIVNWVRGSKFVGVPPIYPLTLFQWKYGFCDGEISHDVTNPPVDDGPTSGLSFTPLVKIISSFGE